MAVLNKELFFFDQPRHRCTKRERKAVDQLPFSLPFTGVSGTLKVEAYLRQQIKISEQSKGGLDDQSPEAGSNGEEVGKNKVVSPSLQTKTREADQEIPRKVEYARKEKLFPGSDVRDRDDDEDEDTQRFLFEENKFAAPNLLAQLGRLLEWLYEKHQEKMNAPPRSKNSDNWPNWANLTSNNLNNSIINSDASYFDLRALDISVPFHLQEKLKWNFDQLIVNTVYSKRQWQTTSYKHQAAAAQRDIIPEESLAQDSLVNTSKSNLSKRDSLPGAKKLRRKSQDEQIKPLSSSETSPNLGKRDSGSSILMMEEPNSEIPASVLGFRRESLKSNVGYNAPRTRLEKYKYLPDKSTLASMGRGRKLGFIQAKPEMEQEKLNDKGKDVITNDVSAQMQQPQTSFIAFSLMSKTCEDHGWVNHESPDLERLTVIEWAHSRLKEAISSRTACVLQAKEKDGPLVVKQYGESRGDLTGKKDDGFLTLSDIKNNTASPAKKSKNTPVVFKQYGDRSTSPAKTKREKKVRRTPSGTAKVELFLIVLPDDTMTLYYPSGKIAVCVAKNMVGEGKYTYVYNDDSTGTLVAYFTPTNAFCSDKQGKQFLCTTKEGTIYDKEGSVVRKWTWKASKLLPAVLLELNEYLTLRIVSRSIMTLHYNAEQESYKVMVGISQDGNSVHLNPLEEIMMTTGDYLSDAAQQAVKLPKPRNKREERRARMNQQKQSQQANSEEIQEQRKEDLDKKFPERRNLALDLPSDIELYKLKRRIKNVAFEWMESYRLLVGISSPVKVLVKHARRKQPSSAKSLPGALPSSQDALHKLDHGLSSLDQRAPSAPPIPRGEKFDDSKVMSLDRLMCSLDGVKEHGLDWSRREEAVSSPVYLTEVEKHKHISARPPFRCGMAKHEPRCCSPKEGCPVALRAEILGDKYPFCRCRKREIPFVSDVAYDRFIHEYVPNTQLLVVSIVSSRRPDDNPCTSMLEQLYYEKNRNRSFPCAQARHDPFRIILYDVDCSLNIEQPLLVKRQNVVPGMFLMYIGGKLLFADHIFNGYGNAQKDFLKQITKSRKDFLQGLFLPPDFRLSPTPCRSGLRAAWGGEIGGLSKIVCRTELNMTRAFSSPESRLPSAVTSDSSASIILRTSGAKSAASFINLYQSIDSPFTRRIKTKPTPHTLVRKTAPQSRA